MTVTGQSPMMPSASRNGLFLGLALVLLQTIFYLADIQYNSKMGYLSYVILIAGLFLSTRNYRDVNNGGFLSYGRGVGYGVLVSLMAGIISAVFVFVLYTYFDPTMIDKILIETENQLVEDGMEDSQIEQTMDITAKMITPFTITLFSIIGMVFMGLVFSLVVSVFLRKENSHDGSFENDTL